ncbi:MAG TPA: addiction module protein [Methylomirabilota bacterium]|nr:addiction module protein [Methylomirabilota bacterium]
MSFGPPEVAEMLALPLPERADLARQLLRSLDGEIEGNFEVQWREELERRDADLREGRVQYIPVEDVIRDLQAELNARSHSS